MNCTVIRCGKTTGDGMHLCSDCTGTLENHLRSTPGLHADLLILLTRQTAASQGPGGSSGESALPYDWKASEVLDRMTGLTGEWVRCLAGVDHFDITNDWDAYAGWLVGNMRRLRQYEAAADAYEELVSGYRQALLAVDIKPERTYAGVCPGCGEQIWGIRGSTYSHCRGCGWKVETDAHMRDKLGRAWDHEANPTLIVRALNSYGLQVKLATVQSWIHRGQLLPSRQDPSKLYRVADVYGLVAESASVGR